MTLFDVFLFAIALVANAFSSIAGGGAGLIQFPILIFLGLPFSLALATHKVATVALGLGSSLRYARSGIQDKTLLIATLCFGLPGVITGSVMVLQFNETAATICLGLLTMSLGGYSIVKKELGLNHQAKNRSTKGILLGGIALFFIGFLNGSLSSGTGLFVTLWFIFWFGLDYKRAIAITMLLVGIFWNGTGAITMALLTEVQWRWLIPLVLGSLVGGYLGAHLALKGGNTLIKRLFEITTITMGIMLLARGFSH